MVEGTGVVDGGGGGGGKMGAAQSGCPGKFGGEGWWLKEGNFEHGRLLLVFSRYSTQSTQAHTLSRWKL